MHKIKLYLPLGVFAGALLLLASAGEAKAQALIYNADTTVSLSNPAINLTIENGSGATSVTTNAGNIQVTVPASTRFTVSSATRNLSQSGASSSSAYTLSCDSSSLATFSIFSGSVETITLTPTALQCAGGGGGGSSGGGGGGSSTPATPATPAIPATPATPTQTPATPATPAPAGAHANGTLVLDSDGTIYLIKNGQRVGFRNPEEYMSHGFKFEQAVPANDTDRGLSVATGAAGIEKALDGTLVLDKTDNRTIYMVAAGKKRGFTTAEVFNKLGYKFEQAIPIDLSDYDVGDVISDGEAAHPNGALVLDSQGTVWWILNGLRQGFESAQVFFTYGFTFAEVVAVNYADDNLPTGPLVKFRDGTLVKDGDVYYLISDGKKRGFSSAETLAAKGYKVENAIEASLTAYASGGAAE